jgi:hypothetical protein
VLVNYAAVPVWNLAESLIIPAGTADIDWWADKVAGGADASTNAALAGADRFWSVQGLHVNLDVDGTVIVSVISVDTDKTTALETIPFRFSGKGTYVVPVLWKAKQANKHLKIDLNGDATASVYVRAFGVKAIA